MSPRPAQDVARDAVAVAARRLGSEGLLVGTAGNVSARVGPTPGSVAVTGSGVVLATCTPGDVTVVTLAGEVVAGATAPTSELDLHLGLHRDRSEVGAVVHTHAPWSTAASCVLTELPVIHYSQLLLGGTVRTAPYATFGSAELAAHVHAALEGRQAALMGSHGSVAVGPDLDRAVEHALLLEWLAALHHRASALGRPHVLTEAEQHDAVVAALTRGYGAPRPAPGGTQQEDRP